MYRGLALRGDILPLLKCEIGVAYRRESRLDGNLGVRIWPVTASLWLTPIPSPYAGGGGWYHTTLDHAESLPLPDETHQKFGLHLGGGREVPLDPRAALDLNGRYVFLETEQSPLPPTRFDPDFWTTTLRLAIQAPARATRGGSLDAITRTWGRNGSVARGPGSRRAPRSGL